MESLIIAYKRRRASSLPLEKGFFIDIYAMSIALYSQTFEQILEKTLMEKPVNLLGPRILIPIFAVNA